MALIRQLIGWNGIDDRTCKLLEQHKRVVMVFPHTSYYDAFLYSLYFLESDILRRRTRVLINPDAMGKLGGILKQFGGVTATAREIHGGGCVKRVVDEVSQMDEFIILLSPKGSCYNHPWRTGFYWFAKLLKCELVAGGFDYSQKRLIVKQPFSVDELTLEQATERCKHDLYDIDPLHLSRSEFPIASQVGDAFPTTVNTPRLIGILFMYLAIFILIIAALAYIGEWVGYRWSYNSDYLNQNVMNGYTIIT